MKKNKIHFGIILSVCCTLTFNSCSNSDDPLLSTSDVSNNTNNSYKVTGNKSRTDKNLFAVSREDVMKFSEAIKPGKDYTTDSYVKDNDTLLYLLNYEDGWVILAGDKRTNPIVAESQHGKIALTSPNENLIAWIESYADEICALKKYDKDIKNEYSKLWENISKCHAKKTNNNRKATKGNPEYKWCVLYNTYCDSIYYSVSIPHLISTKWGQGYPWNNKCPLDVNDGNKRCPTGCVAVSLAQMIYYMHYHLGKPTGLYHTISIANSTISGPTTNIGFSRSSYNSSSSRWGDMALNMYSSGNTTYVGDLMLDVGNRVGMSYSGSGSGANINTSAVANYGLTY